MCAFKVLVNTLNISHDHKTVMKFVFPVHQLLSASVRYPSRILTTLLARCAMPVS